jgi:hypothetical protein
VEEKLVTPGVGRRTRVVVGTAEDETAATEGVTVTVMVLVLVEWMVLVRVVVDSMGTRVGEP